MAPRATAVAEPGRKSESRGRMRGTGGGRRREEGNEEDGTLVAEVATEVRNVRGVGGARGVVVKRVKSRSNYEHSARSAFSGGLNAPFGRAYTGMRVRVRGRGEGGSERERGSQSLFLGGSSFKYRGR